MNIAGIAGLVAGGGAALAGGVVAGNKMGTDLGRTSDSPIPPVVGKLAGSVGGLGAAAGLAFLGANVFSGAPQAKAAAVLGAAFGAAALFAVGGAIGLAASAAAPSR